MALAVGGGSAKAARGASHCYGVAGRSAAITPPRFEPDCRRTRGLLFGEHREPHNPARPNSTAASF